MGHMFSQHPRANFGFQQDYKRVNELQKSFVINEFDVTGGPVLIAVVET